MSSISHRPIRTRDHRVQASLFSSPISSLIEDDSKKERRFRFPKYWYNKVNNKIKLLVVIAVILHYVFLLTSSLYTKDTVDSLCFAPGNINDDKNMNKDNNKNLLVHHEKVQDSVILVDTPVTMQELEDIKLSLLQLKNKTVAPLRTIDKEMYTVRISTYPEAKQKNLLFTLQHLQTCPGIVQIQVILHDGDELNDQPPSTLLLDFIEESALHQKGTKDGTNYPFMVLERHSESSRNDHFHIVSDTPTLGILTMNDDVVLPCEALDAGFFRWTDYPDRMVGYHAVGFESYQPEKYDDLDHGDKWKYMDQQSCERKNKYSMALTQLSFLHRDYLDLYTQYLPKRILQTVDKLHNCEDIAMSLFISALTDGQLPLLADKWAILTILNLESGNMIEKRELHHLEVRSSCTNDFGFLLGLKGGELIPKKILQLRNNNILKLFLGNGVDVDSHGKMFEVKDDFILRRKELVMKLKELLLSNKRLVSSDRKRVNFQRFSHPQYNDLKASAKENGLVIKY